MNELFEALEAHYSKSGHILFEMKSGVYRAIPPLFGDRWDAIVLKEVWTQETYFELCATRTIYRFDLPVLAIWADSVEGDELDWLKAIGMDLIKLERVAEYV